MEAAGITEREYRRISRAILKLLADREHTASALKSALNTRLDISSVLYHMCDLGLIIRGRPEKGWRDKNHAYVRFADAFPDVDLSSVCHTQTTAYSRTLDNASSHATRTNRCTTCHPHAKGFAPSACEGCHGGLDGLQAPSNNAPVVTRYWQSSGHGKFTTGAPARTIVCEDCHDTGYLTGSSLNDGSVPGAPPLNINTENWPGKPVPTADTSPNANTSHLKAGFINTAAATRADVARTFDNFCATAAGCHARDYHRHQKNSGPAPTDVIRFGDPGTGSTADPKQYNWLPFASYGTDFYRSQSPWVDSDIRAAGLPDTTNYGLCVSCHDPHGTATTDTKGSGAQATNAMVRWNWKTDAGTFCARACLTCGKLEEMKKVEKYMREQLKEFVAEK